MEVCIGYNAFCSLGVGFLEGGDQHPYQPKDDTNKIVEK